MKTIAYIFAIGCGLYLAARLVELVPSKKTAPTEYSAEYSRHEEYYYAVIENLDIMTETTLEETCEQFMAELIADSVLTERTKIEVFDSFTRRVKELNTND